MRALTAAAAVKGGSALKILRGAEFYIDAQHSSASGQAVANLGTGGTALNAQVGSSTGTDSNDSKYLDWMGTNYVYLPGVTGNGLDVASSTSFNVTDLDVRLRIAMDDWTPGSLQILAERNTQNDPNRAWQIALNTDGTIRLRWYPTGSAASLLVATSTVAPTVADGSPIWVRVTLDVDNNDATAGGEYEVKFWTSADGATWAQLGGTVTGATGPTALPAVAASVTVGPTIGYSAAPTAKVYRLVLVDGTTTVLDIDTSVITSGAATSFTALTGQTVTVARSATGRKTVAVTAPCWLFGTDDYFEVADNDLLDFAETQSFTVLAAHRSWATLGTNDALVAKKADTTATTAGWALTAGSSTAAQGQLRVGDGAAGATAVSGNRTSGALSVVVGVRDVATDKLTVWLNGTAGTPVTDAVTTTSANAEVMRVGRLSGAGTEYADMGLHAVALWRRALSAAEITALTTYFQARCP